MQYEASLGHPSARTMLAPLVALVIGAAVATGTYALIDNGDAAIQASTRLIVVETPAQHSADIPGKNETATAAAINPALSVAGPDEASTAAAVLAVRRHGVAVKRHRATRFRRIALIQTFPRLQPSKRPAQRGAFC